MLKPNSKLVLDYLREHNGEKIIANDIAEATGLDVKQVNGIVTAAFQKKGYSVRTDGEIELADGSHKKVKFISLTEAGLSFDPNAEDKAE